MRMQSGSTRLRTLLYMDEIVGFFPPVKNPPSKEPMLTLLKQARAFGIGVVLSTQNPVDLDYKGLSNIGTWFVGRLQTRQDIERVIDGLGGKSDEELPRDAIARLLANLPKRTFFLKSAHLESIRLFGTRWVMSYLKGPLKREEIARLMESRKAAHPEGMKRTSPPSEKGEVGPAPVLPASIPQRFEPDPTGSNRYQPWLAGRVTVKYRDQRRGIDHSETLERWIPLETETESLDWSGAENEDLPFDRWPRNAPEGARFSPLPDLVARAKDLDFAIASLRDHLYREGGLRLFRCRRLKLESHPGEDEADFLVRVRERLDELKEEALEELRERYASKEARLEEQLKRAREKLAKEKEDQTSSLISVGASLIGALFGGRGLSASKIGTAINRSGRVLRERGDLSRAEAKVEEILDKIEDLETELEEKIDAIDEQYSTDNYPVEEFSIRPKKSDIAVKEMALVWRAAF
jgi:hypothetical protein